MALDVDDYIAAKASLDARENPKLPVSPGRFDRMVRSACGTTTAKAKDSSPCCICKKDRDKDQRLPCDATGCENSVCPKCTAEKYDSLGDEPFYCPKCVEGLAAEVAATLVANRTRPVVDIDSSNEPKNCVVGGQAQEKCTDADAGVAATSVSKAKCTRPRIGRPRIDKPKVKGYNLNKVPEVVHKNDGKRRDLSEENALRKRQSRSQNQKPDVVMQNPPMMMPFMPMPMVPMMHHPMMLMQKPMVMVQQMQRGKSSVPKRKSASSSSSPCCICMEDRYKDQRLPCDATDCDNSVCPKCTSEKYVPKEGNPFYCPSCVKETKRRKKKATDKGKRRREEAAAAEAEVSTEDGGKGRDEQASGDGALGEIPRLVHQPQTSNMPTMMTMPYMHHQMMIQQRMTQHSGPNNPALAAMRLQQQQQWSLPKPSALGPRKQNDDGLEASKIHQDDGGSTCHLVSLTLPAGTKSVNLGLVIGDYDTSFKPKLTGISADSPLLSKIPLSFRQGCCIHSLATDAFSKQFQMVTDLRPKSSGECMKLLSKILEVCEKRSVQLEIMLAKDGDRSVQKKDDETEESRPLGSDQREKSEDGQLHLRTEMQTRDDVLQKGGPESDGAESQEEDERSEDEDDQTKNNELKDGESDQKQKAKAGGAEEVVPARIRSLMKENDYMKRLIETQNEALRQMSDKYDRLNALAFERGCEIESLKEKTANYDELRKKYEEQRGEIQILRNALQNGHDSSLEKSRSGVSSSENEQQNGQEVRQDQDGLLFQAPPRKRVRSNTDGDGVSTKKTSAIKRIGTVCEVEGCTRVPKEGSVCHRHSRSKERPPHKRCRVDGCNNFAKKGGVCTKHGAKTKPCRYEGCPSTGTQKGGLCKTHLKMHMESQLEAIQRGSGSSSDVSDGSDE